MIAAAAIVLFAGNAAALVTSVDAAAEKALAACVAHTAGTTPIAAQNAGRLEEAGLAYSPVTPPQLASMADTPYGHAAFAQSRCAEGQAWVVGYDRGTCMVMVLGSAVEPVEQRLTALFRTPGTWRSEPIAQPDPDARWTQYARQVSGHHLTAQMKVQPLPATPVKGLVMVTVARNPEKN